MADDKVYTEGACFLRRYCGYTELYRNLLELNVRASNYGLKPNRHLKSAADYWLLEWEIMDKRFRDIVEKIPYELNRKYLQYKYRDGKSREEIEEFMGLLSKDYPTVRYRAITSLGDGLILSGNEQDKSTSD